MSSLERYLREYWFAKKSVGRLLIELSLAKHAYEESYSFVAISGDYERIKIKEKKNISSVELAAIVIVDEYKAAVMSIEKRIVCERKKAQAIEESVDKVRLNAREAEYVRLRYFENKSARTVAQRLYCSSATCGRIRQSALRKIGKTQMSKEKDMPLSG